MKKSITTTTKFRTGDEVVVIAGRDLGKKFLKIITRQLLMV